MQGRTFFLSAKTRRKRAIGPYATVVNIFRLSGWNFAREIGFGGMDHERTKVAGIVFRRIDAVMANFFRVQPV